MKSNKLVVNRKNLWIEEFYEHLFEQSYAVYKTMKRYKVLPNQLLAVDKKHRVNYGRFILTKHRSSISQKPCKLQGELFEQKML